MSIQNETRIRLKRRDWPYIIAVLLLLLLRQALVSRLPVCINPGLVHDDEWVVTRAASISAGQWMGEYSRNTLIKGVFAPLLMAATKFLGITYLGINTLLYCCACLFFMAAVSPLIKNRGIKLF